MTPLSQWLRPRFAVPWWRPLPRLGAAAAILGAVCLVARAQPAQAGIEQAKVIGTGTPESCTEAALDAALAGGGLVTFDCGPDPVTITVTSTKTIAAETTIDGGGRITLSGGGALTIFRVDASGALDVRNLTLADGHTEFSGGAISNGGTLTLTNCTLRGNSASGDEGYGLGGGIANSGTATLTNCTLRANSAVAGGGIANFPSGTLTLRNCTLRGNSAAGSASIAGWGGGIANLDGMLTLTNCALSGNSAVVGGGGIANVTSVSALYVDVSLAGPQSSQTAPSQGTPPTPVPAASMVVLLRWPTASSPAPAERTAAVASSTAATISSSQARAAA